MKKIIVAVAALMFVLAGGEVSAQSFLKKIGKTSDSGGFRGAFFTPDQDSAQSGIDEVQDQGELHFVLPDDRGKGILVFHSIYAPLTAK